jgi:hypothetical protein
MMEAARTSETSADNYFTLQYIPEDESVLLHSLFMSFQSFAFPFHRLIRTKPLVLYQLFLYAFYK